jgi:carboxymethylenebutenolidase
MNTLPSDQQAILAVWQQHTYAEFVLKDADAALATMTENPYVLIIPTGTGGVGKAGVRDFYANHFIPHLPADLEFVPVSQIFAPDHIIEETVARFTHTEPMDWMLPGVPATGCKVELVLVSIIQFANGKVANEHLYWDQAAVLAQLGIVDAQVAAAGISSVAQLLKLTAQSQIG